MFKLPRSKLDRWSKRLFVIGIVGFMACFIGLIVWSFATDTGSENLVYDFELEREEVLVTVLKDGSVDIDYTFVFINHGDLDGIDVGLPNRHYDEDSAWASIEIRGERYLPREIRRSPYVKIGLAVEFTEECRRAAEEGIPRVTVRFHVNNPHMVYENELRDGTVGIRFRPTWFSSSYQQGYTDTLVMRILGPQGHTDLADTYYIRGMEPHSTYVTTEGRIMASWEFEDVDPRAQADGDYDVGMAFPRARVSESFEHGLGEMMGDFLSSLGSVCCAAWPVILTIAFMAMMFVGIGAMDRSRRMAYFDPELTVPGAGPRRDLMAVEAAVVLEVPMERVAAMVLFGLVKKGTVRVDYDADPIRVEKLEEVGEHLYETRFLSAIKDDGKVSKKFLQAAMVKLVEDVQDKMEGFGLEATRDYYRLIYLRAWKQVEQAGADGSFDDLLAEKHDWLLLDEDYEDRMSGLYLHVHTVEGTGGARAPDIRAMARGYVDNLRDVSSHLVEDLGTLTQEVTDVTHPAPEGGGFGGGGGGCACACACACAGGGR